MLADVIVFALTDDIVCRRRLPGESIDEATVAECFGASRTPVREALRQLAASGLVELRPHRAPIVALIDDDRIAAMFDVMAELEALCATRACVAMTSSQRAAFERHHRAMAVAVRNGDASAYRAGNVEFHQMIYEGAANTYLAEVAHSTRVRLAPYRGAQLEAPERIARSYAEHEGIVLATLRGERDLVVTLMRRHLSLTREALAALRNRCAA